MDLAKKYEDVGVSHIIFTDIERDGILAGVSFEQLGQLLESTSLQIIASGGVSSLQDIKDLKKISKNYDNLDGVIVGRAIYEKIFTVDQAINLLKTK